MFNYSGNKPFGCYFCAGMGYEDYPANKIPCRIEEHMETASENNSDVVDFMEFKKTPTFEGKCPYCQAIINCKHWKGLGWKRDI